MDYIDIQTDDNEDTSDAEENESISFLSACKSNTIDVIKYLAEELDLKLSLSPQSKYDAFLLACSYNKNPDVIKYIINDLEINMRSPFLPSDEDGLLIAIEKTLLI